MNIPVYMLQIVDAQGGRVAKFPSGGAVEKELIGSCTEAIVAKGVGMFRTEATVRAAIAEGIEETIHDLKRKTLEIGR